MPVMAIQQAASSKILFKANLFLVKIDTQDKYTSNVQLYILHAIV
jgi:hypothetical protein